MQALLDDPAPAELVVRNPHIGDVFLPQADPQTRLLAFIGRDPR